MFLSCCLPIHINKLFVVSSNGKRITLTEERKCAMLLCCLKNDVSTTYIKITEI